MIYLLYDEDQDMYFFGRPSQEPVEEDFGVYFIRVDKYWVIKTTWENERKLVTREELQNIVREIIEIIKEIEKEQQ